jgi:hypothetical protein
MTDPLKVYEFGTPILIERWATGLVVEKKRKSRGSPSLTEAACAFDLRFQFGFDPCSAASLLQRLRNKQL